VVCVKSTGLRELRQQASELVRQAEAGEIVTITVNGRPVAELGPVRRDQWRQWTDLGAIFAGPADANWAADRDRVDHTLRDPFPA
jgi:prevent-host-death family protein